jgi:hypothetical protein
MARNLHRDAITGLTVDRNAVRWGANCDASQRRMP